MRYINVFCGRYSLATGTRAIAWFYIVLYTINIILNIAAVDIVKSYKENVDEDTDYDRNKLLTFNYICLPFGVVTILLSVAFLVKFSESEDFMQFMVKWNVVRCFFAFVAIIYVTLEMDHIFTVSLSSFMLTVDLCASTYFTGVMASYIKQLEDPNGQVHSNEQKKNGEPSIYLVSHKRSLQTENKVSYVNEVASRSSGFVEIPLDDEPRKDVETNHNSITTANNGIKSTITTEPQQNSLSTKAVGEDGNATQTLNTQQLQLEGISREENSASNCANQEHNSELERNMTSPDTERNSEIINQDTNETGKNSENETRIIIDKENTEGNTNASRVTEDIAKETDLQMKCEKQELQESDSEIQVTTNNEVSEISNEEKGIEIPAVVSERFGEEKGVENPAFDVSKTEPPSVVIIPASPDQEVELNLDIKKDSGDGKD